MDMAYDSERSQTSNQSRMNESSIKKSSTTYISCKYWQFEIHFELIIERKRERGEGTIHPDNIIFGMSGSIIGSDDGKNQEEVGPPDPPENWDRCRAYLKRKTRFCKQWPTDGKMYCVNHQHLEEQVSSSSDAGSKKAIRKRIPCPIDPSQ